MILLADPHPFIVQETGIFNRMQMQEAKSQAAGRIARHA